MLMIPRSNKTSNSTVSKKQFIIVIILICLIKAEQDHSLSDSSLENSTKQVVGNFASYYPFPQKVWMYWSSENTIQPQSIIFINRFKNMIREKYNNQWSFNLVTNANLNVYLDDSYRVNYILAKGNLNNAQKADYIRLCLLEEHGGVYFDLTTIIHNLEWLKLKNLRQNQIIINKHLNDVEEPQALMSYLYNHGLSNVERNNAGELWNKRPGYQNYFIAAKKNAKIIKHWREEYFQNIDLNCGQIFLKLKTDDAYIADWTLDFKCYFKAYYSLYHKVHKMQKQLDKSLILGNRMLVSEYYKTWTFQTNNGPGASFMYQILPSYFKDQEQVTAKKANLKHISFFTKIIHQQINMYNKFISDSNLYGSSYYKTKNLTNIYLQMLANHKTQSCSDFLYINTQSIIYKYIGRQLKQQYPQIRFFDGKDIRKFKNWCQDYVQNEQQKGKPKKQSYWSRFNPLRPIILLIAPGNQLSFHYIFLILSLVCRFISRTKIYPFVQKVSTFFQTFYFFKNLLLLALKSDNQKNIECQALKLNHKLIVHEETSRSTFSENLQQPSAVASIHRFIYLLFIFEKLEKLLISYKITIPYEIFSFISLSYLSVLSIKNVTSFQCEEYSKIIPLMICLMIARKWNRKHLINSNSQQVLGFYQIQTTFFRIYLAKLYIVASFYENLYAQVGSIYFGYFAMLIFDIVEAKKSFLFKNLIETKVFDWYQKNMEEIHQIIVFTFLMLLWCVPNFRYLIVLNEYIGVLAFKMIISLSWVFAFFIIAKEIKCYVYCKKKEQHRHFVSTTYILLGYLFMMVVSVHFQRSWVLYNFRRVHFKQQFGLWPLIFGLNYLFHPLLKRYQSRVIPIVTITFLLIHLILTVQVNEDEIDYSQRMVEYYDRTKDYFTLMLIPSLTFGIVKIMTSFFFKQRFPKVKITSSGQCFDNY